MDTNVKKFLTKFKVIAALAVSFAFVLGSATVMNFAAAPAQAAVTPFTCTSDFYQVSAGKMYEYSVPTNTYSVMPGATTLANLNDIGYNTADNYIYGIVTNKVYKIDSTGKPDAGTTLSATPSNAGGDFVAPNLLLTVNTTGTFTGVNVTTDAVTTWGAATGWRAYDIAYDPVSGIGYGMNGTTLYIGAVNVAGKTVTVTSKAVTGSAAGTGDNWGAAYVDSAGDAYFFDNTTFDLVEISAASLATASPAATNITQANSLSTPNDGASCPTASSPLAPTVVTTAATSVTLTSATLNGTVATGLPASSNILTGGIKICYSTSNTLVGGALSVSPVCAATTPSSLPVNTAATAVTLPVSGLSSGTTYYYQIEATNAFGLEAFGNVLSLTTIAANHTVTFDHNLGSGTMTDEVDNAATALTSNTFTRLGFTFAGWNTQADGLGTPYADGASYLFTTDNTLYAQWTALANHTVTFDHNLGIGTMTDEVDNIPTALTGNTFTRLGFTFTGWNTQANGLGTPYTDGVTYPFTADLNLFAQWTALANHTVTFDHNLGSGTMSNEVDNIPTALTSNTFTRLGFTFTGWNTQANGLGTPYTDGVTYPFGSDLNLFAQWTALANHTVTFDHNLGSGTMTNEVDNIPTALTSNTFTRLGFTFTGWNTQADGLGTPYTDGVTYPFTADLNLFAQWTALATHTVTFDHNLGTGTMANEVDNIPTALTTNTFTRLGFTFAGWNTQANGLGTPYTDGVTYPFGSDLNLFAQWTALANHTVTFDHNLGSGTMTNEVDNIPTALTTNTFTRLGFTFAGWNTQANGLGTPYTDGASYPFDIDNTLYAQWTALATHTVTFDHNLGSGTMANEVDNIPTALTSNTFTRLGFTFTGWNTQANGLGTPYTDGVTYTFGSDLNLFAQWTALPNHTITFDHNNGAGTMADEVDNIPTAITSNTFTRLGFAFAGWNTQSTGLGQSYTDGASYPFDIDTILYAQWTALANHTVTFDHNLGTGTMANEVDNIPTALTSNTFTRLGFAFAGWNTQADGLGTPYTDGMTYPFGSDLNLFAQWTALANHTITFDHNLGSGTMANEVDNIPTALTSNTFTRLGFTFAGWNTQADGLGTPYTDGASYPFDADNTLYAQWSAISNKTVTFDHNLGSGTMANEVDNIPTALTSNTFTRLGFTFAGWNTQANGLGTPYTDGVTYTFGSDLNLFAQWTALANHTITFDHNLGSGTMTDEVDNIPTALTNNTFTRLGFTFTGWNTQADGLGTPYTDGASYPFDTDNTLYAQWTALASHTVTFDHNLGTGTMTDEVDNIPTALTGNTFTRLGFSFAGWNTQANGLGTPYTDGVVYPFGSDLNLFAQWTALPNHTVTFDHNLGSGTMANEVDNIPTALTGSTFTRLGFTFAGWNTQANGLGTPYTDGVTYSFASDLNLFAQWTALPNHTVIFDHNLGSGTMSNEVDNIPTALTGNTFTRLGFTFAGWNTQANGLGTPYTDAATYLFATDGTLFAQWAAIANKTVIFDPNGGTGTMANELDNIPAALTTNAFSQAGYNFVGWNTQANGGGTAYLDTASYAFAANATMFAQWTAKPILTFDANGGTGSVAPLISDVPTNLPMTTIARPGYKFTGWNTAANGSGTAYDPGAVYPFVASGILFAQFSKIVLASTGVNPTPGLQLAALLIGLGLALVTIVTLISRRRGKRATS